MKLTKKDAFFAEAQHLLETLYPADAEQSVLTNPGAGESQPKDPNGRRYAARLMRVNHAGEVAAQALYRGQAFTHPSQRMKKKLLSAAAEEQRHLTWCRERLTALGAKPSSLGPLWYVGSFILGAAVGRLDEKKGLSFVVETERQVAEHLNEYLAQLPEDDQADKRVLEQMLADETAHANDAENAGGERLPTEVALAMKATATVMKVVSKYV